MLETDNKLSREIISIYIKKELRSVWCRKYSSLITFRNSRIVGQDISVGIATRFGLDGPGIESRRRRDFSNPSRPALGPTQGLFHGGKEAGAWR
jgi:hypothetical protein